MNSRVCNLFFVMIGLSVLSTRECGAQLPIHGASYHPVKLTRQLIPVPLEEESVTTHSETGETSAISRLQSLLPVFNRSGKTPSENSISLLSTRQSTNSTLTTDGNPTAGKSRLERLIEKVGLNRGGDDVDMMPPERTRLLDATEPHDSESNSESKADRESFLQLPSIMPKDLGAKLNVPRELLPIPNW